MSQPHAEGAIIAVTGAAAGVGLAILVLKSLGKPVPTIAAIGGGPSLPAPWPGTVWTSPSVPGTHSIGITVPAQMGGDDPAFRFPAAYPRA